MRFGRFGMTGRRRRIVAAAAVAVTAALVGAIVYSLSRGGAHAGGQARPAGAQSRRAPAAPGRTTSSTAGKGGANPGQGPYPVGETVVAVARGSRRMPTTVLYPQRPKQGGFPLIVFSPGFDIAPDAYTALLDSWAEAGFVVAEPDYPLTSPTDPGGVNESDIVNHPADLEAVIDTMLGASTSQGSPLYGLVDPSRVGLAGHSDGGDVTDTIVAGACCRDPRVKAAEVLSGAELSSLGAYSPVPGTALLVVQGTSDTINFPACSEQIYDNAPFPRFYLDLLGAGHHAPYMPGPYDHTPVALASEVQRVVQNATVLFWRAYLAGDPGTSGALAAAGDVAGVSSLTEGAAVAVQGTCPGAPLY